MFARPQTKVWHDPLIHRAPVLSASSPDGSSGPPASCDHGGEPNRKEAEPARVVRTARIIAGPKPSTDPRELDRQRLLARLLAAEGRLAITGAVDAYLAGGFELPRTQEVWLQLLEHKDDDKIGEAIAGLRALLAEAAPLRRAVMESRLRRIEELAEDGAVARAAADLRRFLHARYPVAGADAPPATPAADD